MNGTVQAFGSADRPTSSAATSPGPGRPRSYFGGVGYRGSTSAHVVSPALCVDSIGVPGPILPPGVGIQWRHDAKQDRSY